jgi:hypothetical protein
MFDAMVMEPPTARQSKVLKVVKDDVQSNASQEHQTPAVETCLTQVPKDDENRRPCQTRYGGARKGKSMGKSLGGMAAVTLAEA